MRKLKTQNLKLKIVVIFILIFMLSGAGWAFFAKVRKPAVAGIFYPADRYELSRKIAGYLDKVGYQRVKGNLVAIVVPHAGYDYSGQVAAYAYKELEGREFKRVILLGASHFARFDGISVAEYDYYETALGRVKVDQEFTRQLAKGNPAIVFLPEAHEKEHSLEVQLPFLQTVLKKDFKIVPVIFGTPSLANSRILAMSLAGKIDDETLIVCSTDLSHYHDYETAASMDKKTTGAILKGDIASFVEMLQEGECEACGTPALITTMLLAPTLGANQVELLQYANSGDLPAGRHGVTGDKSRVVGYAAIAYSYQSSPLTEKDKGELLRIARKTLEAHLAGKEIPGHKIEKGMLAEKRGAFVTLTKKGKLRGCIGYIQPYKPLAEAVQEMVVAAATKDSRFAPVTKSELKDIDIEISALSRLKRVRDVEEIKIGRDGLYIIARGKSGLLLPQVATEWDWDRDQFLEQVCYKAGLPKDTWKDKEALLYRFSAEVFHE